MDRPFAIVLGAAVRPDGTPSPTLRRRAEMAVALWHADRIAGIVACGGIGRHPPSEAAVIARLCLAAGVPDAAILRDEASTTTEENLRNARAWLQGRAALVVTDRWHMPRALLVARRAGLEARGAPVPLKGARLWPTARAVMREIPAFLVYWAGGKGRAG